MKSNSKRKFTKSNSRMISGVLGGIADYFSIDASIVRLVFVLITMVTHFIPGVIIYALLAWLMPESQEQRPSGFTENFFSGFGQTQPGAQSKPRKRKVIKNVQEEDDPSTKHRD
ncbi:Stress-responsive transcription regulator [Pediococcus damnosus]|uniref:Stress-responsive transcription regulator n=1 Tax=Pediococcus damnosus TaxID=51663 RepID=A0A0R2HCG6_9LACO|nr:PspC domain-containing protein [Pediococcus damnosus]AMV60036.1 Stress-responsive transcription regulator [Pediococcus damnosus]AMV62574.1 Stress-responsive transcription regulator [Pediococcus damnosus]AMV64280.1 Stress-responsive transcription regulator [Pediococcus damnosus]AMV67547.1 Stress-responsive transcription regulator [Pediococcus damnosus]AMV69104.1 Stress-responsive transcription regulator [Pediococcus damnosus]